MKIGIISLSVISLALAVRAGDVGIYLDSTNGSSSLVVYDAQTSELMRVSSDGLVETVTDLNVNGTIAAASFEGNGSLITNVPETDPVWLSEKSAYATGTPVYVETDPSGTNYVLRTGDTMSGKLTISNALVVGSGVALGPYAVAQGDSTSATGDYSHAGGYNTMAGGVYSHAEGKWSIALGIGSHTEGSFTIATGECSHAEGYESWALGHLSHAEGTGTRAMGMSSHTEGEDTIAYGWDCHAEGVGSITYGRGSHAEGRGSNATGDYSHAEGWNTIAGGRDTIDEGMYSHAEGVWSSALGYGSHAEGQMTIATGLISHAEGVLSWALGHISHAEGEETRAMGEASHTEGEESIAYGRGSHAEGYGTIASGEYSHAEGRATLAGSKVSHAQGYRAKATNNYTFIWADGQESDFSTISSNEFAVRAQNGLRLAGGNLYLDGGPAILVRNTYGSGGFTNKVRVNGIEYINTNLWEDLKFSPAMLESEASLVTSSGVSGDMMALIFTNNVTETMWGVAQLPREWNTSMPDVLPHLHIVSQTTGTGTGVFEFGWSEAGIDGTMQATRTNRMEVSFDGTQWRHMIRSFPSISLTNGTTVSHLLPFWIRRLGGDPSDTYSEHIHVYGADILYRVHGSPAEFVP
ncbi:MAG: hypothetical protein AB7T27_09920 [Kiritimatiellia bacterium]